MMMRVVDTVLDFGMVWDGCNGLVFRSLGWKYAHWGFLWIGKGAFALGKDFRGEGKDSTSWVGLKDYE